MSARGQTDRINEEELLELVQQMRAAGDVTCGTDPPAGVLPLLRLDLRLLCAARVFAADLEVTRVESLVDSQGRDSEARLGLVGYGPTVWAESYVFDATSPTEALDRILASVDSCIWLTDAGFADVGIAASGDAYVVTLGTE